MNAHTDPATLTHRDAWNEVSKLDETMSKVVVLSEQRIAARRRLKTDRLSSYQADKKAAKARYEAELALLDQYITEEKEAAETEIAADKLMVEKAKLALSIGAA